jgi:Transcriptional regulatory protein, C terminal/FHA domain
MEAHFPAELVVSGPGVPPRRVLLTGARITVGRLEDENDIALEPDPQQLVTRSGHLALERRGVEWLLVDGGSVNGTFLRRDGDLLRVTSRTPLRDGDVACVLAGVADTGQRSFFELSFHAAGADSQATRAAPLEQQAACLDYDAAEARLVLIQDGARHELRIRAQAHRLVRHMAERNAEAGTSALCTHEELMDAVWGGEPLHSREELAKLVWELRQTLEPFGAEHLLENERGLGYRLRTCDV